jgi:hypothetical protein
VAVLALGAAACGSGDSSSDASSVASSTAATGTGAPPASEPPPSATSAPPATTDAPTASSAPATGNAQSASDRCTVTDLKMVLGRGDPGAGNIYYPLEFTNTGKQACTLDGYPGVSLLRGDGSTIGKPAARLGDAGKPVSIAPGKTVQADLHTLNKGIKGDSCWNSPDMLKVYPPGSTASMTLATNNLLVCGDTFDVRAVH